MQGQAFQAVVSSRPLMALLSLLAGAGRIQGRNWDLQDWPLGGGLPAALQQAGHCEAAAHAPLPATRGGHGKRLPLLFLLLLLVSGESSSLVGIP